MISLNKIKNKTKTRYIRTYNKYSPIYTDTINIILWKGSKGLYNSGNIVYKTLKEAGYKARLVEVYSNEILLLKSRLNIFLEKITKRLLKYAKYNVLIPNPEWDYHDIEYINDNIDFIIAKTKDCERIFKQFFPNVGYTSFTSKDIYTGNNVGRKYVHFAGKSIHKGTEAVINLWNNKKDLPRLYLYSYENKYDRLIKTDNIIYIYDKLNDDDIKYLQNKYLFHLCPSEYEGFGHQINEAKSASSIVFTTDAPPMNELITNDFGYLIQSKFKGKHRKANLYTINDDDFYHKIMESMELSETEIEEKRLKSRQSFIANDTFFKQSIIKLIEQYF